MVERTLRRGLAVVALSSVGVLLGAACTPARAQEGTSLHDIPWYMANNAARATPLVRRSAT